MSQSTGLRERKKVATRQALISAALRLASERGPDRVTVDDIAEAADVSVRTFFNYFSCKEDAVVGVDPERVEELVEQLASRPVNETPLEAMRAVAMASLLRYTDDGGWVQRGALLREHPQYRVRQMAYLEDVERRLAEALAARIGTDAACDPYPGLVVAVATTAMRVALHYWQAPGVTTPLPKLMAEVFDRVAAGLTPPPRRRRPRTPA
ncbi:MAG TPA: TetR/AcrR family transcriptional regulator [Acidimicrobiales bacterium]|nr:TetR/AcrR family transcriptional regulator [Acidimicrobiales bacterium]